jgi:hypothetical protein
MSAAANEVGGVPDDVERTRNQELELRPRNKEAKLKIEQAQVDRRMKKSEYMPELKTEVVS